MSTTNELLSSLESGPTYRFADWPNESVPKVSAGVYTILRLQSADLRWHGRKEYASKPGRLPRRTSQS
jgi:hypothetical protein